jgi:hypothetical protein
MLVDYGLHFSHHHHNPHHIHQQQQQQQQQQQLQQHQQHPPPLYVSPSGTDPASSTPSMYSSLTADSSAASVIGLPFSPSSSSVDSAASGGFVGCGASRRRPPGVGAAAFGDECSPAGRAVGGGLQINQRFKDYEAFMTSAVSSMTQMTSGF